MDPAFIHRRGDALARTARGRAATYLLAQQENLEVTRHDLPPNTPLKVSPPDDPDDGELFYLLSGQLEYREADQAVSLEPGDCIVAHEVGDDAYFETATEVILLQISSLSSFSVMSVSNRRFAQLAEQVEADEHMEGHSKRLEHMALQLGHRLGISGEAMFHLRSAAFFHDIGKAKVPQHIIQKPVSLTDEEWEIVKRHSEWGREILEEQLEFEEVGRIVEQIHERVDGGGYPRGLTGDETRLEAKIVAVVDAYDAMTTDRPYRKAMAHEDAIAELRANAGTQFDPDVVAAFVSHFRKHPPAETPPTTEHDIARWSQTERFLELGERILAGQDLNEILSDVVTAVTDCTPFRRAAIALYDHPVTPDSIENVRIAHTAHAGLTADEVERLKAHPLPPTERKKIFHAEFRLSRSYYIPVARNPWGKRSGFVAGRLESSEGNWNPEDMLFIPMWLPEGQLIGIISVDDPRDGRAPTPKTIEPLEMFANLTALAIQKNQNIHTLQDYQQRLQGIYRLSESLAKITDSDDLLARINEILLETFDYDIAGFVFVEGEELVHPVIDTKLPWDELRFDADSHMPLDRGLLGWAARHRQSILVSDVETDPHYVPIHPDIRSELVVPVMVQDEIWGVLNIESTRRAAFDEEDRQLLQTLAKQLDVAFTNLRQRDRLQKLATHDQLTGVYNRHYFSEYIETEQARAQRYGHPISLLMIDIDGFYEVNDRFGHQEGDRVLCDIAQLFQRHVRDADTVVRYGGDEFLVLMPEIDHVGAEQAATRIRRQLSHADLGLPYELTVSMGTSTWSADDDRSFDAVLEEADRWMYRRKRRKTGDRD